MQQVMRKTRYGDVLAAMCCSWLASTFALIAGAAFARALQAIAGLLAVVSHA
jgi:NAD(P)H-hydrate repair Nnr-like enzyme with NAD(P)H-hydrate dehydratase domain